MKKFTASLYEEMSLSVSELNKMEMDIFRTLYPTQFEDAVVLKISCKCKITFQIILPVFYPIAILF